MTPPRQRSRATTDAEIADLRTRILRHASTIIGRDGIDGCSISAVARAAGCSLGMIQHHFGTRDGLVLATIEFRSDAAVSEWRRLQAAAPDPIAALRALLAFAVEGDESLADAWGFWVQAYVAAPRNPDVRDAVERTLGEWRALFVDTIAAASDAGLIPAAVDPEHAATLLIAATDGLAIQAIGGFYGTDADHMRAALNELATQMLSLDPAKEPT